MNGPATYRDILEGQTHTGGYLEAHETVLEANSSPYPPHHHIGEERFLISSGTVEATIDGKKTILGPESAIFVASNAEHSIRNVGSSSAQYFAVTTGQKGT